RYLDVGLDNPRRPGTAAVQAVPRGLRLGKHIDLLPPEQRENASAGGVTGGDIPGLEQDSRYEVRYYWGCGEDVRNGQPRTSTVAVRNGRQWVSGRAPQPRTVPQRGLQPDPRHALWPNRPSRKAVPGKASLVGTHRVTGDG